MKEALTQQLVYTTTVTVVPKCHLNAAEKATIHPQTTLQPIHNASSQQTCTQYSSNG